MIVSDLKWSLNLTDGEWRLVCTESRHSCVFDAACSETGQARACVRPAAHSFPERIINTRVESSLHNFLFLQNLQEDAALKGRPATVLTFNIMTEQIVGSDRFCSFGMEMYRNNSETEFYRQLRNKPFTSCSAGEIKRVKISFKKPNYSGTQHQSECRCEEAELQRFSPVGCYEAVMLCRQPAWV